MDLSKNITQESLDEIKRLVRLANKSIIMSSTNTEGIITSVSHAFCDICGYTKEELIGKSHTLIKAPSTPSFIFEDMWETIQNGQSWRGEIQNLKKNGTSYWVYATIEPCFDTQHNIIGYNAVYEDITSKKELLELQAIVIEQAKSATMGEMISLIAHQWKQPLQTLSILIQKIAITKMLEGELTDEFIEKLTQDASLQLNYMGQTIDDFRDFLKPEKSKQSISTSEVVQKVEDFLSYMFKVDSITFKKQINNEVKLKLYLNDVVQVLINIIKNARDAMLEKNIANREITVCLDCNDSHAIIAIQDNAGGIPEAIIGQVFERYFSTKKSDAGTGLGLYMSKKIIEEHSLGRLCVQNKNDGALFTIELPLK